MKAPVKCELPPLSQVISDQSTKFMSETSLHGVQHITNPERRKIARVTWLAVVMGTAAWLTYNLTELYGHYCTFPHSTSLNAIQKDTHPLPAISLCLNDPLDRQRLRDGFPAEVLPLLEQFFLNRTSLDWTDPHVVQELGKVTMQQVMARASFSAQEVVLRGFRGMYNTPLNVSREVLVQDLFWTAHPTRCYTYNSDTGMTADREKLLFSLLDSVTLYLRVPQAHILPMADVGGLYAIVHQPWELPVSWRQTDLAFGTYVRLSLFPRKFRYLPAPYNSLGGKDCFDSQSPDFRSPLRYFRTYSVIACIWEHASLLTTSQCGCVTVGDVDDSGLPHCTLVQMHQCYRPVLDEALLNSLTKKSSDCRMECQFTEMDTAATAVPFPSHRFYHYLEEKGVLVHNTTDKESLKITAKFEQDVELYFEHIPEVTLNDIYSAVGGQMGLFLGASILTILELGEHLIFLLWTTTTRLSFRRRKDVDPLQD